jgi:hypothetical protein
MTAINAICEIPPSVVELASGEPVVSVAEPVLAAATVPCPWLLWRLRAGEACAATRGRSGYARSSSEGAPPGRDGDVVAEPPAATAAALAATAAAGTVLATRSVATAAAGARTPRGRWVAAHTLRCAAGRTAQRDCGRGPAARRPLAGPAAELSSPRPTI